MKNLNAENKTPIYKQIRNYIYGEITGKKLKTGSPLKPEEEWTRFFDVSHLTVRKALNELVKEGIIYRRAGQGTFVASSGRTRGMAGPPSIGVIFRGPLVPEPFYANVIRAADQKAKRLRCPVHFASLNQREEIKSLLNFWRMEYMVKGVVVSGRIDKAVLSAVKDVTPFVLCGDVENKTYYSGKINIVAYDDRGAVTKAVRHLVRKGHEWIGLVMSSRQLIWGKEQEKGYETALKEANLSKKMIVECGADTIEEGYKAFRELWSAKRRPTAFVTVIDPYTIGGIQFLQEQAVDIHRDVGFVGAANSESVNRLMPNLTYVDTHPEKIGAMAVERLNHVLREKAAPERIVVPADLVVRD